MCNTCQPSVRLRREKIIIKIRIIYDSCIGTVFELLSLIKAAVLRTFLIFVLIITIIDVELQFEGQL